jgi:hypothetical protein
MLSFRKLRAELAQPHGGGTLGWHDFQSPGLKAYGPHPKLVIYHEHIHDEILFRTPYGTLQYICNEIAQKEVSTGRKEPGPGNELSELLLRFSGTAHEAAATYLSITAQPASLHARMIKLHPEDYKRFYCWLAEPVRAVCRSSFASYIVACMMTDVVFAPPLAAMFEGWVNGSAPECAESEKPNYRLAQLGGIVAQDALSLRDELRARTSQATATLSLASGDYWDEEDWWEAVPSGMAQSLERIMCRVTLECFITRSTRLFPTIQPGEWQNETKRYIAAAAKIAPGINGPRALRAADKNKILRSGAIRVDNPNVLSRSQVMSLPALALPREVFFGTLGMPTVFLRDSENAHYDIQSDWIRFVLLDNPERLAAARCPVSLFTKALGEIRFHALVGGLIPALPPLVSACEASTINSFADTYKSLVSLVTQPLKDGTADFGSESLFWYMRGDFVEWLQFFKHLGLGQPDMLFTGSAAFLAYSKTKPDFIGKPPNLGRRDREAMFDSLNFSEDMLASIEGGLDDGLSLLILKNIGFAGYFIKLVPQSLTTGYYDIVEATFPDTDVAPGLITGPDRTRISELAPSIIQTIEALWSEF